MRIRELSKELGLSNAEIIKKLNDLGVTGKVASSGLKPEEEEMLRELIAEENKPKEEPKAEPKKESKKENKPQPKQEQPKQDAPAAQAEAPKKNKKNKKKNKNKFVPKEPEPVPEPVEEEEEISVIELPPTVTVGDLADKLGKKSSEIIMKLMMKGVMASINQEIERDLAEKICEDYGVIVEEETEKDIAEEILSSEEDDPASLKERPPVVVVMGHVDHGKTSLLDAIRKTKVTAEEAGGITQHIGAYTVSINGKPITFLDTPGHEAFTAMRMRGALVTDIAVLVVAADDGVMPQTVEAINHAKAAGVDIIVAINKIDKPSANPERVKQELVEYGLIVEDWGGETIAVPVSAVTKEGIDQLLEMITLVAEMKELKANPDKRAEGNIIEARLDKGRGPVATALVKAGTLHVGDSIVVGAAYGKVRAMINDKGKQIKTAGPSVPVEILGLNDVPHAGDTFHVAKNDKQARQVAESIIAKSRIDMLKDTQKISLDDLFSQIQAGSVKELNIVIKADVQGSVEAVRASLEKLSNDEVRIRTIHGGVGAITESDVTLASASNAIIIGFNVRPENSAKSVAEDQQVDIRLYRVIYNAIDDITAAIKGMLDPEYAEKILGHAEVRQTFNASGVGTIAGSYVKDGKITRNSSVRLLRDNVVIYEGEVATLRRYKDDVKEVTTNFECGICLNKFNDIKVGDIIEAYTMEEIKR
ncbi:MAG: translation initiation factor IF-2 [Eubacterium sp.]|nr:translation initiation factor IF-2 [Eubacterium sp.]